MLHKITVACEQHESRMHDFFEQQYKNYLEDGWCVFDRDDVLLDWIATALPEARRTVADPANDFWFRHGRTWFAGVNALNNDSSGAVNRGMPIDGAAIAFIRKQFQLNKIVLDKAQISVYYPGYPQHSAEEKDAAFGYRLRRDAAHVDGLLPIGEDRRRFLREHHHYVLGIPMVEASEDAAPFVIWRGSHKIVRSALSAILEQQDESLWNDIDVTETYQQSRRAIFEQCERVELPLKPGQAVIAHRLSLHGSAPWGKTATAGSDGRMICFFRPPTLTATDWLRMP